MLTQLIQKMATGGKNYSVNECADTLWRTMELKLELPDIITFMVHLEHLMEVEKRLQQLCVEK